MSDIGGNIRYARICSRKTTEDLAIALEVSEKEVNDWENNRLVPYLEQTFKIRTFLNTTVAKLLK